MTTKATAAVIREPKGEFSLETVELDDPQADVQLVLKHLPKINPSQKKRWIPKKQVSTC